MKILFINTKNPVCGVHQYGKNLHAVLYGNTGFEICYSEPKSESEFREIHSRFVPDATIYNWQEMIGGWISAAPFSGIGKQVLIYHDLNANFDRFDAILFSDPTMKNHGNWHSIGRPLNYVSGIGRSPINRDRPVIGVHGFLGAGAYFALHKAMLDIPGEFTFRMHLPAAAYGDGNGLQAKGSASMCQSMAATKNVTLETSYGFMAWEDLVRWLSENDINVYMRDHRIPFNGIASAPDAALCAMRPIAINQFSGFRHLHDCQPSICLEKNSIPEIIKNGIKPLEQKFEEYSPLRVSEEIFQILSRL